MLPLRLPGLVLALALPILAVSDYEYLPTHGKNHVCVEIPEDLRLCYTVGYRHMLLPNLLEHASMAEARQQAGSWVPLVHKGCHPSTQVLLCALFAPVCLETPILPCRWLCEAVRGSCAPVMEAFGFPWPEMLNCSKFPQGDVCMSNNVTSAPPTAADSPRVCPPCEDHLSSDSILENMCASEFAIRTKIKEIKKHKGDKKVILQKKSRAVNLGNLKQEDLRKMVLYLKNGEDCLCQQLDSQGGQYLLMGRKVENRYLLTGIHKWQKSSRAFKRTVKILKNYRCSDFESVFK